MNSKAMFTLQVFMLNSDFLRGCYYNLNATAIRLHSSILHLCFV